MRLALSLALLLPAALAGQTPTLSEQVRQYVSVADSVVAITNVRVVDGTGAAARENQTVVLRGGRIAAVGPAGSTAAPRGARVIDGAGKTVIPGIVGLHNHSWYATSGRAVQSNWSSPRLYLGSGVTTIRTTGSMSPYAELNLKRNIDAGRAPGPRMHVTGPYIDDRSGTSNVGMHDVPDAEAARRVVRYWGEEGATWIKAYTSINREALGAAIDEAHKHGMKVTAHLCSVSFREAVALGIDNLEHGLFVNTDYDPEKKPDLCPSGARAKLATLDVSSPDVTRTFREMIARKVPMTSTLAVYEISVPNRPPLEQRTLDAMAPEVREEYLASRTRLSEPGAYHLDPVIFRKAQEYEVAFVRAGGLLAAGVDPTGNGGALPGFGDQRNYELLIEAGFTPLEAIRIMTLNGATVLGVDRELGSIEAGKKADLVLIDGDPIARPAEIRKVALVFKDGVGYDPEKLIAAVRGTVGLR
jgi:imidazolonepropionase-like amidohydrolase